MLVDLVLERLVARNALAAWTVEDIVGSTTLEPVAAAIQVGTFLLVPVVEAVSITLLIRHSALGKTP